MPRFVSPSTLKEVVAARGVQEVNVLGDVGGYRVSVRYGDENREIAARTREGQVRARTFRTLDTAARYLREIGLVRYQVDETQFQPATIKRPDRAAALKSTHEAAAYDRWFREKVQTGIDAADAGRVVSHADVKAWAESKRRELQGKVAALAK